MLCMGGKLCDKMLRSPCGGFSSAVEVMSRLHGSLQVATKAGVLNVPEWYEAGSVWVQKNPGFPFGKSPYSAQTVPIKVAARATHY